MGSGASASTVYVGTQQTQKCRTPLQKRKMLGTLHQSASQSDATASAPNVEVADLLVKDGAGTPTSLNDLQPLILNLNSFYRQVSCISIT